MRRRTLALWAALAALCLAAPRLLDGLPLDRQPLVEAKYGGWSGVLRLWAPEDWQPGGSGLAAWLNGCIAGFEKRHPGVYVQPEYVDADTLRHWCDGTLSPPELLLFPPGALEDPRGLIPLEQTVWAGGQLARCGEWRGTRYALPVAMGGYLLLRAEGADEAPTLLPEDDALHARAAALAALRAAGEASPDAASPEASPPEIDLGLPALAGQRSATAAGTWRDFAAGKGGSLLAAPGELRRLEALAAQGKVGAGWTVAAVSPFTDQLALAAVSAAGTPERRALAEAFAGWLCAEDCQRALSRAGLFSSAGIPAGYGPGDALGRAEALLGGTALVAPPAFGGKWRGGIADIVRDFRAGGLDAASAWDRMRAAIFE